MKIQRIALSVSIFLVLLGFIGSAGVQAQSSSPINWSSQVLSDGREFAGTPTLVGDGNGTVHVFWPQKGSGDRPGAIYYAYRKEEDVWRVNDIFVGDIDSPWASLDSQGMIHLVWTQNGVLKYSNAHVQLASSGRNWTKAISIADAPAYYPNIVYDPRGILHVVYSYFEETGVLYYIRSTDNGKSWSLPAVIDVPPPDAAINRPQLELGDDGTLHMIWSYTPSSKFYGGLGVYYARSTDEGLNWSNPVRIDEDTPGALGKEAWYASMKVIDSQEIHVVWDAHSEGGGRYHQWSQDGGNTWSPPIRIWGTFVYQTGPSPMMQDSSETLYLFGSGAFEFEQRQGVYYSTWTGSGWSDPEMFTNAPLGPEYIQVSLTGGNTFHLVWLERGSTPQNAWYAVGKTTAPTVPPIQYADAVVAATEETLILDDSTNQVANTPVPLSFKTDPIPTNPSAGLQFPFWISVLAVAIFVISVVAIRLIWGRSNS